MEIEARLKDQKIIAFWQLVRSPSVYKDQASFQEAAQRLTENGCTIDALAPYIPDNIIEFIADMMHAGPGAMLRDAMKDIKKVV